MAVKLNEKFLEGFINPGEIDKIAHVAEAAHEIVRSGKGAGSDFLGWLDLPVNYDKEEFESLTLGQRNFILDRIENYEKEDFRFAHRPPGAVCMQQQQARS